MPNTIPAIDHAGIVREVLDLARGVACEVLPSGAITVGRAGEPLAPLGEMADRGVRVFTDAGASFADARLMRRAMETERQRVLRGKGVAEMVDLGGRLDIKK